MREHIDVAGEIAYVGAIVIKDNNTQRYKIHEVLTINKDGTPLFESGALKLSDSRNDVPSSVTIISNPAENSNSQMVQNMAGIDEGGARAGFDSRYGRVNSNEAYTEKGAVEDGRVLSDGNRGRLFGESAGEQTGGVAEAQEKKQKMSDNTKELLKEAIVSSLYGDKK